MTLFRRRLDAAEMADVARVEDERRRLDAQFARDQATANRAARRQLEREQERAERKRRKAKAKARARRRRKLAAVADSARTVGPLLLVNAAAVGGQTAYAFTRTPVTWNPLIRAGVALVYAATVESISLYVNWHAHDALLQQATGTAAEMRRRAYLIAAVVAAMNYSHFDGEHWTPTPFAVGSGMASLLSPWLWGLHTRRAQHVQLLRKDLVDETGAIFDRKRRRAFPVRTWKAERWSIEHNVRDPRIAWSGYHAHRDAERARRTGGRLRTAWSALRGLPAAAVDEADPGIQLCRQLERQVAGARRASDIAGARLALGHRPLGVWPPPAAPGSAVPATGSVPAGSPELPGRVPATVPAPRQRQNAINARVDPPAVRPSTPPPPATEADRCAAAYDQYVKQHGRAPSDRKLAALAGTGKTYANEWKRSRAAARTNGKD
ncbi:hypothetical protein OOJ91_13595 [Micromonospora lupini]|uniref:hypothetical protein n=1 Tax=Micromonospora lupini TaxID=285679 RepID=UPI00225359DE|nr:hypothetical protein [Micromonospora lupini]MCX5066880.1 hypothetical protein [Micromonospora lupini]